jgi:hypothetical protein
MSKRAAGQRDLFIRRSDFCNRWLAFKRNNCPVNVVSDTGIGISLPHNPHFHISKVILVPHLALIECQSWLFSVQLIKIKSLFPRATTVY